MKSIFVLAALAFALTTSAQEKKQHRSAETGRYVSKSTADKSPSTTYSSSRKSSSTSSTPKSESSSRSSSASSGTKKSKS